MFKKILLLFLGVIISINISSCGDKRESIGVKPTLTDIETIESIKKIDIYSVTRTEISTSFISAAEEEFRRLFDIELSITADMSIDLTGTKSAAQVQSTGANGLYMFPYASISRIEELADTGYIFPMESYLAENAVWNELPSAMRKMYEYSDGHIWALPRGYTKVIMGRVFRADYLSELGLQAPTDLNSLYEVSKQLAFSDPDKNGLDDTFGMVYNNSGSFRDIFYANGVPINTSNDGYQRTSISYNMVYESFEDSMLLGNMKTTLEYIVGLDEEGILRKLGGRSATNISNLSGNNSITNTYIRVPGYALTDEKYTVVSGITGTETKYLNPLTYDFNDGFYVLGANTENPGTTINTFVNLLYGDLEGYLFASRGVQGESYQYKAGIIEVSDKSFFSYSNAALIKSNPLYTYETMNIALNTEFLNGSLLGDIIKNAQARDMYIEKAYEDEIMYDIPMEYAYPEVFKIKPGEIINSSAGTMFETIFSRVLSGRVSIDDALEEYKSKMKQLGMEDIINELNNRIDEVTKFHY